MSIELSPRNSINIRLNCLRDLKSPQICVSLNSSDDRNDHKLSDNIIKRTQECNSCHFWHQIVLSKDMAINRLTEDREELKIKLTLINNQNIELTQKLKRILNQKQTIYESDRNSDQSIDWKTKCDELQAINEHLRQHLNTLKTVFNDLHNSSESTTNQTINTSNNSNTLVNENSTTNTTNNNTIIGQNSSTSDENSTQNSKTPFDQWYNK